MSQLKSLQLGFAPSRRQVFSREEAMRFRAILEKKMRGWGVGYVGLEGLNEDELLFDVTQVPEVAKRFREAGVQALFTPLCNFGCEAAITRLAQELLVPILLWGPRDDAPGDDGLRLRDSQCGLFATGKDLRRAGVPFSYLGNCWVEDPALEWGLKTFLGAANVVRTFKTLRIGQVGTRPGEFASVICSEAGLIEDFGIDVVPLDLGQLADWTRALVAQPDDRVADARRLLGEKYRIGPDTDAETVTKMAAVYVALHRWLDDEGLTALGMQCWSYLQDALGIAACWLIGLLEEEGIHLACETDLHGAITSALLSAATLGREKIFFADLTVRHPDNPNAELLWHCGPFPPSLAAPGEEPALCPHFGMTGAGCLAGQFRLKQGDLTVARFDGDHGEYRLMAGEGHTTTGPATRGTYVWMEVGDWPRWEDRLVRGPYIHHVSGAYGHHAAVLHEACRYLPGIESDLFEPTEEEVQAKWRAS